MHGHMDVKNIVFVIVPQSNLLKSTLEQKI
jgi:hypothetical protein